MPTPPPGVSQDRAWSCSDGPRRVASFRYASNVPPSTYQTLDPPRADGPLRLVFSGECLDGYDPQDVRRTIASALKLDEKRAARLFSGKPLVLRREVDVVAAHRYIARFALMGAVVRAEPSKPRPPRTTRFEPVPAMDVPTSLARPLWRRSLQGAGIGVLSIVVGLALGLVLGPGLNAPWTETRPPGASAASGTVANVPLLLPRAPAAAPLAPPAVDEEILKDMPAEAEREYELRYLGAPDHKAFAMSSGGVPVWVAGAASAREASERALVRCMEAQQPGDHGCQVVDVDGNWQE